MTESKPRSFPGVTLKHGVIIAGLVGVLGFLFLGQDDGAGDQPTDGTNLAEVGPPRPSSKNAAAKSQAWTPKWPEVEFDQAVSHNPFAPLTALPETDSAAAEQALLAAQAAEAATKSSPTENADDDDAESAVAEFQSRGVSMIFRNKQKTCALIGDRVVHEGDVIDGVKIVAITTTEVIVEPATKTP